MLSTFLTSISFGNKFDTACCYSSPIKRAFHENSMWFSEQEVKGCKVSAVLQLLRLTSSGLFQIKISS